MQEDTSSLPQYKLVYKFLVRNQVLSAL